MYYNKNLFVNEQLRTQVQRLEKKQLVALISIVVSALLLYIGAVILLVVFLGTDFPSGYAAPALSALLFTVLFAVIVPITKRIDKYRTLQTVQLKNTVYYEKYAALLQAGKKCQKLSYCLVIPAVALSLIISLVLAILFPYEYYYSYMGFLFPLLLMCVISVIILNRSRREIKNSESELIAFFAKQYEVEMAKAQEQAQSEAEAKAAENGTNETAAPASPTTQQPAQN